MPGPRPLLTELAITCPDARRYLHRVALLSVGWPDCNDHNSHEQQ
ncbi:hypothetical protein TREES_T100010915 [Tupaia chinensis]|uniref:Uncharacterized protein n=1 Tax=Tupaia chinensis TaxID=246437 RepID=L9JV50_TUPCH|nr:hypothetical protein TREES_T100010915 [Tupaia chinensis]